MNRDSNGNNHYFLKQPTTLQINHIMTKYYISVLNCQSLNQKYAHRIF